MGFLYKHVYAAALCVGLLGGCGGSDGGGNTPSSAIPDEEVVKLMEDSGLSTSSITAVYMKKGERISEVKLFRVNGQEAYVNAVGVALLAQSDSYSDFRLYVDKDNNASTGFPIQGMGADVRIGKGGPYVWKETAWVPELNSYKTVFRTSSMGDMLLNIVAVSGTQNLFLVQERALLASVVGGTEQDYTPVFDVQAF